MRSPACPSATTCCRTASRSSTPARNPAPAPPVTSSCARASGRSILPRKRRTTCSTRPGGWSRIRGFPARRSSRTAISPSRSRNTPSTWSRKSSDEMDRHARNCDRALGEISRHRPADRAFHGSFRVGAGARRVRRRPEALRREDTRSDPDGVDRRGGVELISALSSTPPGFAQRRVELVDIGLNLLAAAFVDELPPPHAPGVRQAHSRRGQLALDVVDAFAEHDFYPVGPLAVYDDVQDLPGFRYAYLDPLRFHQATPSIRRAASRTADRGTARSWPPARIGRTRSRGARRRAEARRCR